VSADIVRLSDYRSSESEPPIVDLETAVDVAIRDLDEVLAAWGSEAGRTRARECVALLRIAYAAAR
jgi:hypothetical protein